MQLDRLLSSCFIVDEILANVDGRCRYRCDDDDERPSAVAVCKVKGRAPMKPAAVCYDCHPSRFYRDVPFSGPVIILAGTPVFQFLAVVVCVSVCLSVTSRCSTETAKRRITQTTPWTVIF